MRRRAPGTTADTRGVAEIICEAEGSTTILTPRVLVQPDGVHVHLVSHLDEPAEIIGLAHDADPGETEWVSHAPPGTVETACNLFRQHGSGEAPPTIPVEILDPDGIYLTGEIQCSGTSSASIGDFAEAPLDVGPVPLEKARKAIRGLDDDDQVLHAGYPKQRDASVIVRRHGQIVASFGYVRWPRVGRQGFPDLYVVGAQLPLLIEAKLAAQIAPTRRATWNSVSACC